MTSLGAGFRYAPHWSPDSRKVAFIDQAMRIHVTDIASGKTTKIDESPEWLNHGGLAGFSFAWSPDSRWVSYSRPTGDANSSIFLYDTQELEADARDDRLSERHAADLRSGRQVSVLRVRPRVRSRLRQLRQQLDLSESDADRRGPAEKGRSVAAARAQRRRVESEEG